MCVCTGVWLLPEGRWSYRSDTPQIHNDNIDNYLINSQSMTISFGGVGSALWISGWYGVDPDGIQILKCFRSVLWRDRGAAALTVSVLKVSGRRTGQKTKTGSTDGTKGTKVWRKVVHECRFYGGWVVGNMVTGLLLHLEDKENTDKYSLAH